MPNSLRLRPAAERLSLRWLADRQLSFERLDLAGAGVRRRYGEWWPDHRAGARRSVPIIKSGQRCCSSRHDGLLFVSQGEPPGAP